MALSPLILVFLAAVLAAYALGWLLRSRSRD